MVQWVHLIVFFFGGVSVESCFLRGCNCNGLRRGWWYYLTLAKSHSWVMKSSWHLRSWVIRHVFFFLYLPGTQMTLVLIGKGLVLAGWPSKIEVIWVPGRWWFQIFLFSSRVPIWEDEAILTHIFQMGWNHQPAMIGFNKMVKPLKSEQ